MFDPGLRLAKVCAVHPDGYSIDVKFYDDGSPASNVQVLSGTASTCTGFNDLPSPATPPGGDQWNIQDSKTRDMIAVIGFVRGMPIALGFLYPQVNQMLFSDKNRMIYRHVSGVYFTIDSSGNAELYHPSGAFVRFGSTSAHENLTGKDLDGKWKIPSVAAGHIHIEQAGGKAAINIDPTGNITITNTGNVTMTSGGNVAINATGNFSVTAARIDLN